MQITFLCNSSALSFSSFSLSASGIAVFDNICLFGVGLLGLNDPDAFFGSWELVCFFSSPGCSQLWVTSCSLVLKACVCDNDHQ